MRAALCSLVLLAVSLPARALECTDFRALLEAEVPKTVTQRIVYEAPPLDGWACLEPAGLSVVSLDMAVFFARLDPQESLRWTVRARRCEAGTELRRGTRRLIDRLESKDDAPALDEVGVGPGSDECKRVAALQAAIQAR